MSYGEKRRHSDDIRNVKKHKSSIAYQFQYCIPENRDNDIYIKSKTHTFRYSKMILRRSSVFSGMLDDCSKIPLVDDVCYFNLLLNILYTPESGMEFINSDNFYEMYILMHKYDIHFLDHDIMNKCLDDYDIDYKSLILVASYDDIYDTTFTIHMAIRYLAWYVEIPDTDQLNDDFWIRCLPVISTLSTQEIPKFRKHILNHIKCPYIKTSFDHLITENERLRGKNI